MLFNFHSSARSLVCSARRSLFSLPSFPSFPSLGNTPQTYHQQRVLPYTAKEAYRVVADVASYPRFVPFCTGSRIDESTLDRAMKEKTTVEAELSVGFLNFEERYTSTVTCSPFKSVEATASSSTPLFRSLSTTWSFHPQDQKSVLVSYALVYEFASPIHAAVSSSFFGQVAGMMIHAFEKRCADIYGPRGVDIQKEK